MDILAREEPVVASGGGDAVGLSIAHISPRVSEPRRYGLSVARGGQVVSVNSRLTRRSARCGPDGITQARAIGGDRGRVRGFSRQSRLRLMKLTSAIDRQGTRTRPQFITLTYPAVWPDNAARVKRDLDVFFKAFRRAYPLACIIWRVETQQRGAPHLHFLCFGVRYVPASWLAALWYRVVGSDDPRHLAAGTEVRAVRSWDGVLHYVGKYLAKASEGTPVDGDGVVVELGRVWGVLGRDNLPLHYLRASISEAEFIAIRRLLRRFTQARSRGLRYRYKGRTAGTWVIMRAATGKRVLSPVGNSCHADWLAGRE